MILQLCFTAKYEYLTCTKVNNEGFGLTANDGNSSQHHGGIIAVSLISYLVSWHVGRRTTSRTNHNTKNGTEKTPTCLRPVGNASGRFCPWQQAVAGAASRSAARQPAWSISLPNVRMGFKTSLRCFSVRGCFVHYTAADGAFLPSSWQCGSVRA